MAAGLPPPYDSDGVRHARRDSSITGRDVSVTTRSPSAREPSRPADRRKLQMSQAPTPLINKAAMQSLVAPVKQKPHRKTLLALQLGTGLQVTKLSLPRFREAPVDSRDNLTIGTIHYNELQIGTNGLTMTPLSDWPVTCMVVPFKNGPCSEKRRKKH